MAVQVYFIGAGPGDIELLTIKGRKIIERADVIIYADSLVNPEICSYAKAGAEIHGSASLTLDEIISIISDSVKQGKTVARLQSGDPSIYGAISEQMRLLNERGIEYEVIPGVSSLFASAAALKTELTMPELSQTVIITRLEGNTPVPSNESLRSLTKHRATLAIFLSVSQVERVVEELLAGGYQPDTPAAVVYRASWKDQKLLRTTIDGIAKSVKESGIKKQALILVGEVLGPQNGGQSRLYNGKFDHGFRKRKEK